MLYRLLSAPRIQRIMFEYRKLGAAFVFERHATSQKWGVQQVSFDNVSKNLNAHTVYIVDGKAPSVPSGQPILAITSPRYSVYSEFTKSPGVKYVLDMSERKAVNSVMYVVVAFLCALSGFGWAGKFISRCGRTWRWNNCALSHFPISRKMMWMLVFKSGVECLAMC